MNGKLLKGYTLSKMNPFLWSYNGKEIFIGKEDKNNNKHTFIFSNEEVDGLIEFIQEKGKVSLDNSISIGKEGSKKNGIGSYIYNNIDKNTSLVQTASQLVSILYNANVLHYNNKKKGMEFWINNPNWKYQLLEHIKIN